MPFQLVVDCRDPLLLARFWADALGYVVMPVPDGFASYAEFWRSIGVPEEEIVDGPDSIVDPTGAGPRIWFQVVPEAKTAKNRLHIDIGTGGGRGNPLETRRARVDAEVARLVDLGASVTRVLHEDGIDHYAVAMIDPEGNEFDVN